MPGRTAGRGKTSLGRSIARSLGRKFVRMSLGGIRDEAEIRGHRRTYVEPLPGRILQGMRKSGSHNPRLHARRAGQGGHADFRGDPTSALLEVLDPEQNSPSATTTWRSPSTLSKTMFIATANISRPSRSRSWTRWRCSACPGTRRKRSSIIATDHFMPRVLSNHGLKKSQVRFSDEALNTIINEYTREAGVRNLEREIASLCRKIAKSRVSGDTKRVAVTPDLVRSYPGPPAGVLESRDRIDRPGVATGLAWTPVGGDILFIESTSMRGKGGLSLTGQLGDVMKESAQAALSWIRTHAAELGIELTPSARTTLRAHVPQGAIPKDGPRRAWHSSLP